LEITRPQTSDPLAPIWYGVIGLSVLSIAALAFIGWRLKASTDTAPSHLDSLRDQIRATSNAASRAKLRYDELVSRASRPTPSLAPPARIDPQPQPRTREIEDDRPTIRTSGPRINLRPGRTPDLPPTRTPAPAEKPAPAIDADLVHAYTLARSSSERGARDRFDSQFPYIRISCTNHEDWQYHKNVTLRFEREDFGWYLMVNRGGNCFALPWFTQDLASERESFQGVFDYPEGIGTKLRIGRAAVLQPQGDSWTLVSPGEVRSDA
jgi:hypothetical protein